MSAWTAARTNIGRRFVCVPPVDGYAILRLMKRLLTRENLLALGLCLLVILLIIVTADAGPTFIYQRF